MEFFDPNTHQIPLEQIRELIDRYIPLEMCRCYGLIPLSKDDGSPPSILVGMMNPDDLEALDRLNRQLKAQGLAVRRIAIASEHYQQLMREFLDENTPHQPVQSIRFDLDSDLDAIARLEVRVDETDPDLGASLQDAGSASIVGTVNTILAKALQEGVSDIHVEPQAEQLRIRFRKDGVLSQVFPPLPRQIIPGVVSRFKIMAGLDIAERRCPQVGRIRRLFQDRKFDLRVSTLPNRFGEKIVVRLQEYAANPLRLEQVMQKAETRELVKHCCNTIAV